MPLRVRAPSLLLLPPTRRWGPPPATRGLPGGRAFSSGPTGSGAGREDGKPLDVRRVLVISKVSRYQDEAMRRFGTAFDNISPQDRADLDRYFASQGTAFDNISPQDRVDLDRYFALQGYKVPALRHSHDSQVAALRSIQATLTAGEE
ncbi:hypothetical protein T484DRAFT_1825500 [Baffinella frigidus]|nr:hypothetical protein T484DRAFT_1825500 [Cryptophyta sp. CCMP2293]